MDIGQWLSELGLQAYEQAFRDNGVDLDVLSKLTAEDLKEIGVTAVGHRRKILSAIDALAAALPDPVVHQLPRHAERRQLTLMFCDLVGSTAISGRLDPEDLQDLLGAYRACVADVVGRHGGFLAKHMGDGALVYFGYPQAQEDDAERAVRAGLRLVDAVAQLVTGERLAARVGIATGLVVVGDLVGEGEAQERGIAGETPNLAARLQERAAPGAVVISETTKRLVGDLFEVADLGVLSLKGFAEPIPGFRVMGEGRAESRFAALHGTEFAPLVGREEELELVLARWRHAREGRGQVVLVSGEPGIGKSRLVLALRERLGTEARARSFACSPHHVNSALFPFIAQLEREAEFSPEDTAEQRLAKLERLITDRRSDGAGTVALYADLLGIAGPSAAATDMAPLHKKVLLFRSFVEHLEGLARDAPILIVLEDAHWLDPTSRELFDQLVERVQRLPVLLIATFRLEMRPPWTGFPHVTLLTLSRLAPEHARTLVERVLGGRAASPSIVEQILARTEGIPLFAEELTKVVVESGLVGEGSGAADFSRPQTAIDIPATLHDSLMARLDRLAPVKDVAQIGACIGREFDHELLSAIVHLPEADLQSALDRLVNAELLFRRGVAPAATYVFKHALVRDAAYQSLLRKRRQELHARIATALEANFPQMVEGQPEIIAGHLGEAGLFEKAADYWLRAGRLAASRSANVEAISHLRVGLDSLSTLPAGQKRSQLELSMQLAIGAPLIAIKGFASIEAEAAYQRAKELSRGLGSLRDSFAASRGLVYVYLVRARLKETTALVDECAGIANQIGEPEMVFEHSAGALQFHLGAFQASYDWLEKVVARSGRPDGFHAEVFGVNTQVFCRAYMSHCLWHLGYPDRALAAAQASLRLARELSHPFSLAIALNYIAMLHQFRSEADAVLRITEESSRLCDDHGFDYYGAWSAIVEAWAKMETTSFEDGLGSYHAALQRLRATGAALRMPHYLGRLATLNRKAGRRAAGLRIVEEAAGAAALASETWCDAELERERGELLLLHPAEPAQAEAAFRNAINIARTQGARMLEMRASIPLARLLAGRGERQQAVDILSRMRDGIMEGLETPELRDATQLLQAELVRFHQ